MRLLLIVIITSFSVELYSQSCASMPAVPLCGGSPALSNGVTIGNGDTYYVDNPSTDYNSISLSHSNGTLIICSGTHTITSFNLSSGKLYVLAGATLSTDQNNISSGIEIYNWGTINFTAGALINSSSGFVNEGTINFTGNLSGNNASIDNRGSMSVSGTLGDWQNSGRICQHTGATISVANINWGSINDWIISPSGSSCISYNGTATVSNTHTLSPDADLQICKGGSALSGSGSWGSATVVDPCSSCASALPIELAYFKVDNNGVHNSLYWETYSETDNQFFTIEYSNNGIHWTEIGNVLGNGTTNEVKTYSFEHTEIPYGMYYYRLKQTDYNGTYSYSKIVTGVINTDDFQIHVQSANKSEITLMIEGCDYQNGNIEIINTTGQKVYNKQITMHNDIYIETIPFSHYLAPGTYFILMPNTPLFKPVSFIIQ